jgi:hypothetical protein
MRVYRKSPSKNGAQAQETVEEGSKELDVEADSIQQLEGSKDFVLETANPSEVSDDNGSRE